MTLEELAEKHCETRFHPAPYEYKFTLDQLRAFSLELIKQVTGELVAYETVRKSNGEYDLTYEMKYKTILDHTPLHAINMEILK